MEETGWKTKDLNTELELQGSSLQYKWDNHKVLPSFYWISKFAEKSKVIAFIYSLPLWELLTNKPISRKKLGALTDSFRTDHFLLPYNFPDNKYLTREEREPLPTVGLTNSPRLVDRGDIYGFMAIAALVREEELDQDPYSDCVHIANLIRALPAVGRTILLKEHFDLLCKAVVLLKNRSPRPEKLFRVHWKIIKQQAADPLYEPCREFQERDPSTRRFVTPADPLVFLSNLEDTNTSADYSFQKLELDSEDLIVQARAMAAGLSHITRFMETAREWKIDSHLLGNLLGRGSEQTHSDLYNAQTALRPEAETRMKHIFEIKRHLDRVNFDSEQQRQYIRTSKKGLSDKSILEALCVGDYEGALETARMAQKRN